jgi:hypothetical protein
MFTTTLDEIFSILKEYIEVLSQIFMSLHVKVPVFLSDIIQLEPFPKNYNIMKILSVGADFFHTNRRTGGTRDMTKPIVAL